MKDDRNISAMLYGERITVDVEEVWMLEAQGDIFCAIGSDGNFGLFAAKDERTCEYATEFVPCPQAFGASGVWVPKKYHVEEMCRLIRSAGLAHVAFWFAPKRIMIAEIP